MKETIKYVDGNGAIHDTNYYIRFIDHNGENIWVFESVENAKKAQENLLKLGIATATNFQ